MLAIEKVDLSNKSQVDRFIRLPFRLYRSNPCWVPPFYMDMQVMLNPQKHPFYEHSKAEFYLAVRDGRDVGRIAVLRNTHFIEYHGKDQAHFTLFDCEDDLEAATALFDRACEWARAQGLTELVGPRGLSSFDGYGILIDSFDKRAIMTMVPYNHAYYQILVEKQSFVKEVDFISFYMSSDTLKIPEEVHIIARKVKERGLFDIHRFKNKKELVAWAPRIGEAYNGSFVHNWEYYPLSPREVDFVLSNIMTIADPRLIKVVTYKEKVVGFGLAFPDISAALQRAQGHLNPISITDMLIDLRRTRWVTLNGGGILPEYQGRGGNALMYAELENILNNFHFKYIDLPQNADTASQMRSDILRFGARPYKTHRVYRRSL
jgi:hypothetical protein